MTLEKLSKEQLLHLIESMMPEKQAIIRFRETRLMQHDEQIVCRECKDIERTLDS